MVEEGGTRSVPAWRLRHLGYALLLALPLLAGLGGAPLFDVDEGAFSEATREMLASGDFGHTTLNGLPRFDKPIGVYWLQALSVSFWGLNEFALRLPSALSGWAMALALAAFAWQRWGERAGAFAGVVAATSLGVQAISRAATADGLLNLLLVLAALDLWRFAESGRAAPLRRAYAWVGLGLLVKGPVAVLVPGAAFSLWALSSGRWDRLRRAVLDAPGWLLLLVIAVPWYVYAYQRHGMAFIDGFLMRHNVQRFAGTLEGHRGSPLYYLLMLPLLAMPWAPMLAVVAAQARRLWAEPLGRYLLGWTGFVLLFFSFAGTKLPHYALYGYAPVALLAGRQLASAGRGLRLALWAMLIAWTLVMLAAPWQAGWLASRISDPLYRALLGGAPSPDWGGPLLAVSLMAALAVWPRAASAAAANAGPQARLAGAALVLGVLVGAWATPWWGEALQGPVKRAALAAREQAPGATVVQWQVHLPSLAVYLGQPAEKRAPGAGELALTRRDRLAAPAPQPAVGAPVNRPLFEERGIVLIRRESGQAP